MRVFFDASVLIAALLSPTGGSAFLLRLVQAGALVGITSQTVIDEVLAHLPKLQKTHQEIEEFIAASRLLVREGITIEEIAVYKGQIAEEDAHLIAGARQTNCAYLVSLDKRHVLPPDIRARFLPLKILSPGELLQELVI
jgi:putative PIN family toxin of toxin-antitoxin system